MELLEAVKSDISLLSKKDLAISDVTEKISSTSNLESLVRLGFCVHLYIGPPQNFWGVPIYDTL